MTTRLSAIGLLLLALAVVPLPEIALANPRRVDPVARNAQSRSARAARVERQRQQRQRRARLRRYRRMARGWHRRAPRSAIRAWASAEPPPLVLRPVGRADRLELTPASDDGGFDADDLALAEEALRHREGGSAPVHPRLVELVYRAVRHFQVPWVHVVSGYRPDSATSRHTQGRAIDMVLPGVSDRRLATFLQRQGFVGVGIYAQSGFVHLDVRARSYFWIDRSWPGDPKRTRPILRQAAQRHDQRARRRGEEPVPDLEVAAGDADGTEQAPALDGAAEEDG